MSKGMDRSGGWAAIVLGAMFIVWAAPSLMSFAFGEIPIITIRSVRIAGNNAALAAGIMAAAGLGMLLAGLRYLGHRRQ
jgi:hypothetical protein